MKCLLRTVGLVLATIGFCVATTTSSAVAQAQVSEGANKAITGVGISPSLKEVVLNTGLVEASVNVIVSNNTDQDLSANIRLVNFEALDQFGGVSLDQEGLKESAYSLAPWMSLPGGESIDLPAKQSSTFPVTIRNDSSLAPGGHYGAVVISLRQAKSGDPSSITLRQQLASLIFVKKIGGEIYGTELEDMKATGLPGIPTELKAAFKSTGNVHVVPRGYVEVTDPVGKLVAKGIINPDSTMILPGNTRRFVVILKTVAAATKAGRYRIAVSYRYDGKEDFETRAQYFTYGNPVRPILLLATAGLLVSVLSAGGYVFRSRIKRYATKQRKYLWKTFGKK